MKKRVINPWTWQNKFGFVQANVVADVRKTLYCAGQISVDENGNLLHPYDMEKQIEQILINIETLLTESNFKFSDIARIIYYTTDINEFTNANINVLSKKLSEFGCKPATTLIGVAALARPECLVELEVTAVI